MPRPLSKAERSVGASHASLLAAALATGLAGAAANGATSLSAAPRALASFGALLGPTAAAAGALFLFALVVLAAGGILLGARLGRGAVQAAAGCGIAAGAALWPLAGATRAGGALLAVAVAGVVLAVLAFARGRAGSAAADARWRALLLLGAPLAALLLLSASWARTYSSAGTPLAAGLAFVALALFVLAWRAFAPLPALAVLFALAGSVAAAGLGGLLRGDGDLRIHVPRSLDAERPSPVILITVDTLRPDFLSAARAEAARTPAMDALLADSVVFTQARASAPWTKPSVATILTGLSPLVHGTTSRGTRLPVEVHTLAEHLQDAGYVTAGMGLNVHLEPFFGFDQGFDEYLFPVRKDWGDSLGSRLLEEWDAKRFPALFPSTEALGDVAVRWIEDNADRDFFLWIHVLDPHWPYAPPAKHVPPRTPEQRIGDSWGREETVTEVQAGTLKLGEADRARVRALYRGEIEYVDANLARVFAKLREKGLYDKALIAFTSDHGEEFWEHGTFEHGHTLYDEVLRVPLAFKLPGASVKTAIDVAVGNEALLATVLELAEVEPRYRPTARSLARFWTGGDARADDQLAAGTYYYGEKRMLLSNGRKLILDFQNERVELFDLAADPAERRPFGVHDAGLAPLLDKLKAREAALGKRREELGIQAAEVQADEALERMMRGLGYGG